MDSRIICLNSADAKKLNGDYNSNLYFDIPNIVDETHLISHIEVALEDATIPVSWYLINDTTNTLNYIYNGSNFSIVLTNGNYNGTSIITELTQKFDDNNISVIITLSQVTGLLLFKFNLPTAVEFVYATSTGLMRILGFKSSASGLSIVPELPMNLLGIQKINICSSNLATISSFSSSSNLSNQIIQSIPVDMPAFHQITYINKASHYGRLKNRYINNIDIQLFDEYGRYIEMNGIEFNLSFNIKIYRKYNVSHDIINQLTSKNEDSKKDLVDEKNSEDPDLELLLQK
jgi:hypothetical protein